MTAREIYDANRSISLFRTALNTEIYKGTVLVIIARYERLELFDKGSDLEMWYKLKDDSKKLAAIEVSVKLATPTCIIAQELKTGKQVTVTFNKGGCDLVWEDC